MIARLTLLLLAAASLLPLSGCAAVKATQQPDKKNVAVLYPGTPRTVVIAELGPPRYTEVRDGLTTDLFVFKQGYSKGVKASRAFLHGTADVMTGFLWEVVGIPIECLANGTDVKVEVTYDPQSYVQDIAFIQGEEIVKRRRWFGGEVVEE